MKLPPLIEPHFVQTLFLTGGSVDLSDGVVHFTGWFETQGDNAERRIQVRFAMTEDAARHINKDMTHLFSHRRKSGH